MEIFSGVGCIAGSFSFMANSGGFFKVDGCTAQTDSCKDELEIERVLETSGTIVAGMLYAGMLCIHLLSGAVFMMTS